MAVCRFGSPSLVSSLSGIAASPTFAFNAANTNYLGLSGSFTANNGAACSFPTQYAVQQATSTYAITPIIVNTGGTRTCSILAPPSIGPVAGGSTTYSGIECPSVTGNALAPGTYTLRFNKPNVAGVQDIGSQVFVVASPTFSTAVVTTTIVQTTTAPPPTTLPIVSTTDFVTVTVIGPTGQTQTVTQTLTGLSTTTTTITDTPSSCASSASSPPPSTPTGSFPVSQNGQCGVSLGQTCAGSAFGNCCSMHGWCGSTDDHCSTTGGCQARFGTCITPLVTASSVPPAPSSTDKVSLDGTCGGANGFTCPGSGLGDCCSPYGWCGDSTAHCGAGCQRLFGNCAGASGTVSAPLPTSTNKVSLDGSCGGAGQQTCEGSTFGSCCSEYGYCGSTEVYCSAGCQPAFGTCTTASKRSAPKGNLRAAPYAAVKRSISEIQKKRAIGGAGPDYTYPPIPQTTVTSTTTLVSTLPPLTTTRTGLDPIATNTTTLTIPAAPVSTVTTTTSFLLVSTSTVRATQTTCPASA